jgi:threonine aldolase
MITTDLKAGCSIDLSFPFHKHQTPGERLREIGEYMDREGLVPEMYLDGPMVQAFEEQIADTLGKPAAMWCPTGTMAQGIAARLHAEASGKDRILLHPTSHLELHEQHGYQHVHQLKATPFGAWSRPLQTRDLVSGVACAFIELPQRHNGGALPSWAELEAIKTRARDLDVPLHMDGARLWSTRTFYEGRPYGEITNGFASVYASFYKDIGALGGAVLAGEVDFVEAARTWRDRMGGLLVSPWPLIPDAQRLMKTRLGQMPAFVERARDLAQALSGIDGLGVTPEPPHVNMMHLRLPCSTSAVPKARDEAARQTGVWLGKGAWAYEGDDVCSMEITIGERATGYDNQPIVDAVTVMLSLILADQSTSG